MSTVLPFSDIGPDDVALVGGKGANLGALTTAGLPVPPGFVVTAEAYRGPWRREGCARRSPRGSALRPSRRALHR